MTQEPWETVVLPESTRAAIRKWAQETAKRPIPDDVALKLARLWDTPAKADTR